MFRGLLLDEQVESDHFANFYAPQLAKHGYSALYKRKTNPVSFFCAADNDSCLFLLLI